MSIVDAVISQQLSSLLAYLFLRLGFPQFSLHLLRLRHGVLSLEVGVVEGPSPFSVSGLQEGPRNPCKVLVGELINEGPPSSPIMRLDPPATEPHKVLRGDPHPMAGLSGWLTVRFAM